jgi:D-alanine-D-alanine ligase
MTKKIRVAVLYGGRSGEHEVSLVSATNVIRNLDRNKFEVVPIGIDKQGGWFLGDDILKKELADAKTIRLQREAERMLFKPDLIGKSMQQVQPGQLIKGSERIFDVVFPVIHGTLCEDGTVQGLLELADIPYVGCGVLSSAVGMDKDVSKRLIMGAGMPVPRFVTIRRGQWDKDAKKCREFILSQLTFPVFVKPANTGSSVGVNKVKKIEELDAAILDSFQYDLKLIIEQGIDAREIELSVLESLEYGADPIVSVTGEIKPKYEFYNYTAKYIDENGADLVIPAPISAELEQEFKTFAKKIFVTLECEGMARVDLFLERNTNKIFFNEINTIPGFTQLSMYPKLLEASGVKYSELLTHLVMLAIARHGRKSKLSREYAGALTL